jgi:hypothetical protein
MSSPCKRLDQCLTFGNFNVTSPNDKLYVNAALSLTVNCPDGSTPTVQIPAGVIGYVLNFQVGTPPYPDLQMEFNGQNVVIQVPDSTTPDQLDALVMSLLGQIAVLVAKQIGCVAGVFYNTQQVVQVCTSHRAHIGGAIPAGITVSGSSSPKGFITVAAGLVSSSISAQDANLKAIQLAQELFYTQNVICSS